MNLSGDGFINGSVECDRYLCAADFTRNRTEP
jgi:hypothetical protein